MITRFQISFLRAGTESALHNAAVSPGTTASSLSKQISNTTGFACIAAEVILHATNIVGFNAAIAIEIQQVIDGEGRVGVNRHNKYKENARPYQRTSERSNSLVAN